MLLEDISLKLQAGKAKEVEALVRQAIDEKIPVQDILNKGLLSGMDVIGEKFRDGEVFIPEVLVAARAMNKGVALLKPLYAASGVKSVGKACVGTVQGDLHDIGKNLVASMLEGSGFEVVNLGINVDADKFVAAVKEQQPQILCLSALLTTTMNYMKDVIEAVKNSGLRDTLKIMVGGAPLNAAFAAQVGADAYTADANECVQIAKSLLGK